MGNPHQWLAHRLAPPFATPSATPFATPFARAFTIAAFARAFAMAAARIGAQVAARMAVALTITLTGSAHAAAAQAVAAQAAPPPAAAQRATAAAAPSAPAPRTASGKPDLSGVWTVPYVPDMSKSRPNQKGMAELPFTAEGAANFKAYDPANGDYTGICMPFGLVRSMNAPYPMQIMQNDKYVALLWEQSTWFHVIPVDQPAKASAAADNPQWFGHSVGHWDGDTLVVETSGFNGYTRLDTIGHPHSDQLKVRQTFNRTDADHIAYTITIDDPKMYTKPWSNERVFTASDGELIEYSCEENNKSLWEGRIKTWTPPWAAPAAAPPAAPAAPAKP